MHFDQLVEGVRLSERNPKMVKSSTEKIKFYVKWEICEIPKYNVKSGFSGVSKPVLKSKITCVKTAHVSVQSEVDTDWNRNNQTRHVKRCTDKQLTAWYLLNA